MRLRLFNTRSMEKEDFVPLEEGCVRMYVCGPTVYDNCHVGHARSYVAFDVLRSYLSYNGLTVTYVQNFTDVDDKIINRARERGIPPLVLSEQYIQEYFEDMGALNVQRATIHPKASETIPDMINIISSLIGKGYAYEVNGSVYFEVEKAKERFGQLRHQSLDDMRDGARIEVDEEKRSPKDFALWKRAKEGEISWDSPWGRGRPGWHIECSTMSTKYLGDTIDIHGGGMDLVFPHHESEILQSESYSGQQFVRYWVHNGFVQIDSEKMSKSLGNFFTIKDVLERFEPMVLRFFLLYTHYRSPIDFSDQALEEAGRALERLRSMYGYLKKAVGSVEEGVTPDLGEPSEKAVRAAFEIKKAFMEAMDDDLNTRVAIVQLFRLDDEVKAMRSEADLDKASAHMLMSLLEELSGVLGLSFDVREEAKEADPDILRSLIELLLEVRNDARKNKDWRTADLIRDRLGSLGVRIEDTGEGTSFTISKRAAK
ncbi:MAG: cysteine--tRNA ligase [Candidatus Thermoplasmatota archaeon]|nr:cysteine--tRNA ligase [Candidatus Thermoplasmatota archaeon]